MPLSLRQTTDPFKQVVALVIFSTSPRKESCISFYEEITGMWHDPAPREEKSLEKVFTEGFYHHGVPFPLTWYKDEVVYQTSQDCSA